MRIISIQLYKQTETDPILLASATDLSFANYFSRSTIKEFVNFNSRLVVG
jgi:hypothetical protein